MTRTYEPGHPIWCAGCGHFGVKAAIQYALDHNGVAPHDALVLAGIGCSGTVQNNIGAYGFHAMHGRVVPNAIGASLANPELAVIAAAGDGDGYAIGAGHLVHALKRNANFLYVVMNNGVYGLTKGQDSPTMETPHSAPEEDPLDAMALGLSIRSTTFLARAITTRSGQMNELVSRGLEHALARRGMALVEVLSPCVTYNDTYPDWMHRVHDVDAEPGYHSDHRGHAFARVIELSKGGRIPIGQIYRGTHASLQDALLGDTTPFRALDDDHARNTARHLQSVLSTFGV